jgi:hypothetical protein
MKSTLASQRLLELMLPDGARVAAKGEAVEFSLHRSGLHVAVTVPLHVREWFAEALDRTSGARVEDWCDYDGYDTSPADQRDLDMANDVGAFVEKLLSRELRLGACRGTRVALESKVGEAWEQAIPFVVGAV